MTTAFASSVLVPHRTNRSNLYLDDSRRKVAKCNLTTPTDNPTPSLPSKKVARPPSPLQPPQYVTSNPLTSALYKMFSSQGSSQSVDDFCSLISSNIFWSMPLFDARSTKEVSDSWKQFFKFAIDSTVNIYSVAYHSKEKYDFNSNINISSYNGLGEIELNQTYNRGEHTLFTFEWTVSFLYPLPWRPRVSFSGQTTVKVKDTSLFKAVKIVDNWYVQPLNVIRQSLPKLKDLLWLFPAPPCESDIGQRYTISKKKHYKVIQQAPRSEMSIFMTIQDIERELVYVTPKFPGQVYEGNLKRREFYSTVTPVSVRYAGSGTTNDFECMIPVPSGHLGSANVLIAQPMAPGVVLRTHPQRVFAIYRFSGYGRRTECEQNLQKFIRYLRQDGLWTGDLLASDVWIRTYDATVGFNSKALLSIIMYGTSIGVPRINEIAIDITDTWRNIQEQEAE